jgi:hypothetical protein
VLAVKANQPYPLAEIGRALEAIEQLRPDKREQIVQEHHDVDKGHGRIEPATARSSIGTSCPSTSGISSARGPMRARQ